MNLQTMLRQFFLALLITVATVVCAAAETPYVQLFNGQNLDGWRVVLGRAEFTDSDLANGGIFSARDGVLHVFATQTDGSPQPFGVLVTEESFENYELRLEYKWGEKKFPPRYHAVRDAGILFHLCSEAKIWPRCVECQIQEGDTGDIWAIGTRVTSRVHDVVLNYSSEEGKLVTRGNGPDEYSRFPRGYYWEQPGWNKVSIRVEGDHALFKVNGQVVNEVIDMRRWDAQANDWAPLTSGPIALQAEGAELFYRDIKIRPLE